MVLQEIQTSIIETFEHLHKVISLKKIDLCKILCKHLYDYSLWIINYKLAWKYQELSFILRSELEAILVWSAGDGKYVQIFWFRRDLERI